MTAAAEAPGRAAHDAPEHEQYQVYSRIEIIALLREIQALHALVTIYFDGGERFALTNVLAVNPEFEELVLDAAANAHDNEALVRSQRLVVITFLHHVKIQFRATRAERTTLEGRPALRIRLPDSMLRFQRREAYRVQTPVAQPLKVVVPAMRPQPSFALKVFDLSCGGVGVHPPTDAPALEPGQRLHGCMLALPGIGEVHADLEVRHLMRSASASGPVTRCGLQFIDLSPAHATLVQRYINRLDRDRRSRT
jgi:c-di-GMP-binding flagellar brake protein YcgR